jgi:VanZ family protein
MTRRPPELRFFTLFMHYWLPVLVYVTIIITVSGQPNLNPPIQLPLGDKAYHFMEYLVLGLLVARAMRASLGYTRPAMAALLALSLGIVVGTGDEFWQSFIPGRESSGLDLVADTIGLIVAQIVVLLVTRD